jgi:hypothetical protein
MNNSVFGKTMEDVRNRINYELVTNEKRMEKTTSNPTHLRRKIIKSEDIDGTSLVGVEKMKPVVKLNKPIYCGFTILELSKVHMQDFYYNVLKPYYGDKVKLCYTDTDSFVLSIETEDVYDDFMKPELNKHMDFSDYPKDHKSYNNSNKKVLGKFKDEENGKLISEFIALKPKMYAIKTEGSETFIKAKGVPKRKAKTDLTFEKYKSTLDGAKLDTVQFNTIRSNKHEIYTLNQTKTRLSNYDDKRYHIDKTNSYPYGHFRIEEN